MRVGWTGDEARETSCEQMEETRMEHQGVIDKNVLLTKTHQPSRIYGFLMVLEQGSKVFSGTEGN